MKVFCFWCRIRLLNERKQKCNLMAPQGCFGVLLFLVLGEDVLSSCLCICGIRCVFMPVSQCGHMYICVCVCMCGVHVHGCACMCLCVCRLEADFAVSFHRVLLYLLGRVSCWTWSFPGKWAGLPRGFHFHPGALLLQMCCHAQTTFTWALVSRFRPSHVCYPNGPSPQLSKEFLCIYY